MESTESLKDIIDEFLNASPLGTAIVFDDMESQEKLSYNAMSQKVKEIIAEITKFFKEGDYAGIHAQNSLEIICVLFSLLKLKVVCCPFNLSAHESKVLGFLRTSDVRFAIVSSHLVGTNNFMKELTEKGELIIQPLKCLRDLVLVEITSKKTSCLNKHNIEFMIASSGSTGHQKVIRVPGKCILPNITDLYRIFNVTSKDIVFMSSPLTFDASFVQIFISVVARATLLIVPDKILKQTGNLCKILFERNQITILQATPSLFHLLGDGLLQKEQDFTCTSLRILCLGAEPFPSKAHLRNVIRRPHSIELFNIYGISEVSSWASIEKVDLFSKNKAVDDPTLLGSKCSNEPKCDESIMFHREVSIGFPLSDTKIELKNENGCIVTEGYGEIWIGGRNRVCLINDEENSFQNTMRPSGDIGLKKNDIIYYIRRKDNRVKIFGKFVDLEQIENVAEEVDEVKSSICIYSKEEENHTVGSLILFLATKDSFADEDLKRSVLHRLNSRLPGNHLLFRFVFVKDIPLNLHGKKDRLKLKRMAVDSLPEQHTYGYANFEEYLFNMIENVIYWQSTDFQTYDRKKSFIENGGDSFAAIFLESQIRDYMAYMSNNEVSLTFLYDRITTRSFEELNEYLSKELEEMRGSLNQTTEEQEADGNLKGKLKSPKTHGELKRKSEGQGVFLDYGASDAEMLKKEIKTTVECTSSNEEFCQAEYVKYFPSNSNWKSEKIRKRNQGQHEQEIIDEERNFVEPRFSMMNDEWLPKMAPQEKKNEAVSNCGSYDCTRQNTLDFTKTLQHKESKSLCDIASDIGCYCSVSRGNKYSVCDYCIGHGSKSICSSILTNLSIGSSVVIKRHWICDTLKCVDASPLIVCSGNHLSRIVYIGSHSHFFYAINGNDGNVLWRTKLGDRIESSAVISRDGKTIIVGCYDHNVYIISRQDGTKIWQLKTGESVKCSPVVSKVNGFVFIGSHDHHVYAIDTENYSQVWRTHCGGGSIFSSPTFSENFEMLFVCTLGGNLVAIDSETGVVHWKLAVQKPIFASPLCVDEHVCFCRVDGYVYLVTNSGVVRWSFQTSGPIFSSPSIAPSFEANSFIVGSHDGAVYCISNIGKLVWRTQLDSPIYSTPAVILRKLAYNEGIYEENGSTTEYLVFICSTDGALYVLNSVNGVIIGAHAFSNEIFSSPVVFGSSVVVGCRDNNVYCLSL